MSSNSKRRISDALRPVLRTFSRPQLQACFKLALLPRGGLALPEWIFAVGDLTAPEISILLGAADALSRQPSYDEVMMIVRVTAELDRIVANTPATR
jgi:hypothetical protein